MSHDTAPSQNDELQAFIMQLYRLFKVGSLHLPNNESIVRTCERTAAQFHALETLNASRLSILFLEDTVFLNGRLLKADRNTYECAVEIARYLNRIGYNELVIERGANTEDIQRIAAAFHSSWKREDNAGRVKMRRIDPDVLATLMDSESDPVAKLGRTYAQAVVAMRYVYDALRERRVVAPRNLKRLMQQFCLLANEDLESFTALTRMRNPHDDDAGHSVKAALVAMGITRLITLDLRVLARIGLATLLYDVGRPRATYLGLEPEAPFHPVLPLLQPDQMRRLPASSAVMVTAIARLHPDAIHRAIAIYNGQLWDLARQMEREFDPDLESVILSMSWKFVRAMAFDVRMQSQLTPRQAFTWLRSTARTPAEQLFCELLAHTLLLTPDESIPAHAPQTPGARVAHVAFETGSRSASDSASVGVSTGSGKARYRPPQRVTETLQPARATGSFLAPTSAATPSPAPSPAPTRATAPPATQAAPEPGAAPPSTTGRLRPVQVVHADSRATPERSVAVPTASVRAAGRTRTGATPVVPSATPMPRAQSTPPPPTPPTSAESSATRVVTGEQSARLLRSFVSSTPARQALGPDRPPGDSPSGAYPSLHKRPAEPQSTRVVTGEQSSAILRRFVRDSGPAPSPPPKPAPHPAPAARPTEASTDDPATRAVGAGDARSLLERFQKRTPPADDSSSE